MILWKPPAVGRHCSEVIKQRTFILNTKGNKEVNPWNEESIREAQRWEYQRKAKEQGWIKLERMRLQC